MNGDGPDSLYQDLQRKLKGYRSMLPLIPLILGGIAILIHLVFERKYHHKLALLAQYGFTQKNGVKLHLQTKAFLFFLAILVIIMPLFN